MPDSAPVQPDEVTAAIEAAALTAFCGAIGYSDRERVRAAVAAALTLAREDIAARMIREWPGGHRG